MKTGTEANHSTLSRWMTKPATRSASRDRRPPFRASLSMPLRDQRMTRERNKARQIDHSRLGRFEICTCMPTSKDLPSSLFSRAHCARGAKEPPAAGFAPGGLDALAKTGPLRLVIEYGADGAAFIPDVADAALRLSAV